MYIHIRNYMHPPAHGWCYIEEGSIHQLLSYFGCHRLKILG